MGYFKITILREPETQFVSSFKFYHDLFPQLALKLNPDAEYNQKRRETRDIRFKPSEDDVIIEMERFLDNPWTHIRDYTPMDWSWMALIRPQLLFFGTSPKNIASYDRAGLNRDHALEWIEQIMADFDQIMILEHLELSLAVLSLQLNIPTDDLIYVAVNQQTASVSNTNLDAHARLQLHRLNWPDFLLYEAANATLWRKIESLGGFDVVNKVADEIKQKSSDLSNACLDVPSNETGTKVTRPTVKADKVDDQSCKRLAFQGT